VSGAPGARAFAVALSVWLLASLIGSEAARTQPLPGLAVAGLGGLLLGVLSARRVDPRRERSRRRRREPEEVAGV